MKKLLVANWKLNPQTESDAVRLARASDAHGVVICPPFVYVSSIKKRVSRADIGAQDAFWEDKGPYTGEVSPAMLKKMGVQYAIIGHSERRKWLHETDEMINKKIKAALKAGLRVILCVGEPKREARIRNQELRKAKAYVRHQLLRDLKGILDSRFMLRDSLIIAYEPLWAIGTGRADDPEESAAMAAFIKKSLNPQSSTPNPRIKVLYGGSVTSKNIGRIISHEEIDGALVGGASLRKDEFSRIIKITNNR